MKLRIIILLLLVLMAISSRADPKDATNENGNPCAGDPNSPTYWEKRSIMPVEFVDYRDNNLTAHFASGASVVHAGQLEFNLPEKLKDAFFRSDKEWGEEISRKEFLKKYKKDYWLVTYVTENKKDTLCQAYQFKNWGSIYASFGHDLDTRAKFIDTPAYWHNMKTNLIAFHNLTANKAYWLFLAPLKDSVLQDKKPILTEDGRRISGIIKIADGSMLQVLGHGVFKIDKNTVFHVVETKEPRVIQVPKISITSVTIGRLKIRPRPVDRAYFNENYNKSSWLCFFENDSKLLLRVIGYPIQTEGNGKNNGNGKKNNHDKNFNNKE